MPLENRIPGQEEMEWDLVFLTRSLVVLFFKLCTCSIEETFFLNFSVPASPPRDCGWQVLYPKYTACCRPSLTQVICSQMSNQH